ncbi:glycosyltransferase family 2 [Colletotrichum abscissum]
MRLWLKSKPREVIIVTVERNRDRIVRLLEPLKEDADKIVILCAPLANKRVQLVVGVKAARGSILALVDDDVYWRAAGVLPYLLAPFENAKVGAVAGIQSAEIRTDRQDPNVITVWEATSTYDLCQWKGSREVHFAADGGCWCLSARTLLIRASILQDPSFVNTYTHEIIGHKLVNTADDVVLTGWVFDSGWEVFIQNVPEAEITTNIPEDHKFALQILRWDRGNFRTFLGYIFVHPGLPKLMRFAFLAWVIGGWGGWVSSYKSFLKKYPYCGRQWWGFIVMDLFGPVVDIYVYFTMNNDSWLTRVADIQEMK